MRKVLSVTGSTTTAKSQRSRVGTKRKSPGKQEVKAIIRAIREGKKQDDAGALNHLACRIKLGELLCRLKAAVGHGGWLAALAETGYDDRKAQRLMSLPESSIDQIRTSDPDLAVRLPTDLQQLAELRKLSEDQLREAFAGSGWYFEDMSRAQVAAAVKDVLAGKPVVMATDVAIGAANTDTEDGGKQLSVQRRDGSQNAQRDDVNEVDGDGAKSAEESGSQDRQTEADEDLDDDTVVDENDEQQQPAGDLPESDTDKMVDEAAHSLHAQLVEQARQVVEEPAFAKFTGRGAGKDELFNAIIRRVRALLIV